MRLDVAHVGSEQVIRTGRSARARPMRSGSGASSLGRDRVARWSGCGIPLGGGGETSPGRVGRTGLESSRARGGRDCGPGRRVVAAAVGSGGRPEDQPGQSAGGVGRVDEPRQVARGRLVAEDPLLQRRPMGGPEERLLDHVGDDHFVGLLLAVFRRVRRRRWRSLPYKSLGHSLSHFVDIVAVWGVARCDDSRES